MGRFLRSVLLATAGLAVGLGVPAPGVAGAATVSPASLDFGAVKAGATSPPQVVTYSVTPTDARNGGVALTNDFGDVVTYYAFTTTCPATLPPGSQTCQVTVTFKPPSGPPATLPATLLVGSNSVPLTGRSTVAKKPCKKKGKKGAAPSGAQAAAKKKRCKKK